jgi:NAD-dependent deacetylase
MGDLAPDGAQLRPHICFFHETPYNWEFAQQAAEEADIFVVIGTSLSVYPAAGLVDITSASEVVLIDPNPPRLHGFRVPVDVIAEPAGTGVPAWTKRFL